MCSQTSNICKLFLIFSRDNSSFRLLSDPKVFRCAGKASTFTMQNITRVRCRGFPNAQGRGDPGPPIKYCIDWTTMIPEPVLRNVGLWLTNARLAYCCFVASACSAADAINAASTSGQWIIALEASGGATVSSAIGFSTCKGGTTCGFTA